MKAITPTALALLLGLGLALPAAAGQPGAGTDGDRYATAGEAVARAEQGFLGFAGGEEGMQDPSFTNAANAATEPRNAGVAARQEVPRQAEPATGAQGEQPRPQQVAQQAGVATPAGVVDETGIEIALTPETLRGTYITDADRFGLGGSNLGLSVLLSEDRDIVGSVSLVAPGVLENVTPGRFSLFFGGTAYAALLSDPSDDVFALAPGVGARLALPAVFDTPSYVVGSLFYSPEILTFGDSDDVVDFNVRYELQFTEATVGFVGFRMLSFDREGGGEDDIVEDIQLGLRFGF